MTSALSYHDLHITTPGIARTSIAALPYNLEVHCCRVAGWQLWRHPDSGPAQLLAGEYDGRDQWLVLDVDGHVIVDSRSQRASTGELS